MSADLQSAENASETPDEANKEERCAQLLAQGQIALAQAEGCGGEDQPIYAGSTLSLTQTMAPAYRTLPDNDNGFYAVGLYVAPRLTLTEKWALNADITLAYEATPPDDTSKRNKIWTTDTRLTASGNLGSLGGFTLTGGPRLVVPTSELSWAADVVAGTGGVLNVVRSLELLSGLAFVVGGSYVHTWSGNLTREVREGEAPTCTPAGGGRDALTDCPAGRLRVVQDQFRAVASASLNFTPALNLQASYLYGWNLVKPFKDDVTTIDILSGPTTIENGSNVVDDTRWRRLGSLTLALSYQPTSWFIATLQGNTTVCYDQAVSSQSALGGCAAGQKTSGFWLRNPIANKFSTLGLQLTIPVDALVKVVGSSNGSERRTARARARAAL